MSCYCKLSVLIPHLKSLSAQKSGMAYKDLEAPQDYAQMLFKRYI